MRLRRLTPAVLGLGLVIASCVGRDLPTDASGAAGLIALALQPALIPSAADGGALPINRIRALVVRTADSTVLVDRSVDVSPTATSWTVDLSVPLTSGPAQVRVAVYLLNVASDGVAAPQFSGRSAVVDLAPGATINTVDVDIVRGPLANLDVTGVTITSAPTALQVSRSATLAATATTSTGPPSTPVIFWTSLSPAVLTMSGPTATGVATGAAMVVASAGRHADTVAIDVFVPPVDSIHLVPDSADVWIAGTVPYRADLFDAQGQPLFNRVVTWTTGNAQIATVSNTGVVSGVALGTTYVRATSEGVSDDAVVRVTVPPTGGPVIGGWDATRGGDFALATGSQMSQARASLTAAFPSATLAGMGALTSATLAGVDALVISAVLNASTAVTPLSAAEQTALLAYARAGGCVVLLADNNIQFQAASQSMVGPFGMATGGGINGLTTATVSNPAATNVTNGAFGQVSTFQQNWPGAIVDPGAGAVLATNPIGPALVVLYDDALGAGSGPVIVFSDSQFDNAVLAANDALWRNVVDVCANVGLPAPPPAGGPTISWTLGSNGNWSNPANWSLGRIPAPGDTVLLTQGVDYQVTLDVDATVARLVIGGTGDVITLDVGDSDLVLADAVGTSLDILALGGVLLANGTVTAPRIDVASGGSFRAWGTATLTSNVVQNAGDWTVESGGFLTATSATDLEFLTSGTLTLDGVLLIDTDQSMTYQGGAIYGAGGGLVLATASVLNLDADLLVDGPFIQLAPGVITGGGLLTIGPQSLLYLLSAGPDYAEVNVPVANQGTIYSSGPTSYLNDFLTVDVDGVVVVDASDADASLITVGVDNAGSITTFGSFDAHFGPAWSPTWNIVNGPTGEIVLGSDATNYLEGELINQGILTVVGPSVLRRPRLQGGHLAAQHVNDGSIDILSGSLEVQLGTFDATTPTITNSGTILVGAGTTLSVSNFANPPGQVIGTQSGVVMGNGTVDLTQGSPVGLTHGFIAPGLSPGTLTWVGNVPLGPTGTLAIELEGTTPGTGHDRLDIGGTLLLDFGGPANGVLDITSPGFTPQPGDRFAVLTYAARTGRLLNVSYPNVPGITFDTLWVEGGAVDTLVITASGTASPTNLWTWMSGSTTVGAVGVYGTLGQPAASNVPGARDHGATWTDGNGGLWLFGGQVSTFNYRNDLWRYDGTTWTWMSGSNSIDSPGSYGQLGVTSPTNEPPARRFGSTWTDADGAMWLFGGDSSAGTFNDLWLFDGNDWTWISGSNTPNQFGVYGQQGVPASGNVPGARAGAMTWIDANGNLWLFGGVGYGASGSAGRLSDIWRFDGTNWTWMDGPQTIDQPAVYGSQGTPGAANTPGGRLGGVTWIDSSGDVWLFGGTVFSERYNTLWRWDGTDWTWVSGSSQPNQGGTYGSLGVPAQGNVPGGRVYAFAQTDALGLVWLFGGQGYDSTGTGGGFLSDLWRFDGATWTWMAGPNLRNQPGVHGTLGVPNAANVPGGRSAGSKGMVWITPSQDLWIFGGSGLDGAAAQGYLNDLWRWRLR